MGAEEEEKKRQQPPDYPWQLLKSASRPKAYAGGGRWEGGGGDENGRKPALIVFLYQGADLAQDGDSVLWTSCSSDGSCGPPSPLSLSVSSSIHPILCHPLSLLPIQDASYFPRLDSYMRKCPNSAWHPRVDRTQLFISIIHLIFPPLFIVASFFSSLRLFFFFFSRLFLQAHYLQHGTQDKIVHTH